jgi:uncharacterized protein YbbC (DUF1343 family)
VTDVPAFDLLTGSAAVREAIERDAPLAEIAGLWAGEAERFSERRAPFLLY